MSRRQNNGYHDGSVEAPAYDDTNRAFLQAFFSHSIFTIDTLRPVVAAILTAQGQLSLFACSYVCIVAQSNMHVMLT